MVTQRMGRGGARWRTEGLVEWVGVGDDEGGGRGVEQKEKGGGGKGTMRLCFWSCEP